MAVEFVRYEWDAEVGSFIANMKKAENSAGGVQTKLENASTSLSNFSSKTKYLSAGAVGALGLATKSAIDFESAFAGVEKTVDGTTEQMDSLKQGIRDMALEIPASTTEIAAVAEAAGQLGIETDNVLEFTETMVNMGVATNLSADEAATSLARFANITGMSQKDFDRLGSTIVALGNNFATTESEITAMSLNLASAGTQIGLSEAEIAGLATALSSVGLEAQGGGTAFSKLMIEMQLAVETGSESLEDFARVAGLTTEEFKEMFKSDPAGALQEFIGGLNESGEAGESAIKILDDMGITETRLRDALLRSAGASDVFSNAIKVGTEAWEENTALSEEAAKRYATTESQIQLFKNTIADLGITLGSVILPILNDVIKVVGNWVAKFSNASPVVQKLTVGITAFVAALSPVSKVLSGVIGSVAKVIGLFTAKTTAVAADTVAQGANATATAASTAATQAFGTSASFAATSVWSMLAPILAIIAAIALIVAAFLHFYNTNEEFRASIDRLVNEALAVLNDVFSELWAFITNYIIPVLTELWNYVSENIIPIIMSFAEVLFEILIAKLEFLWYMISTYVIPVLSMLWDFIKEKIIPIIQGFADILGSTLGPVLELIWGILESVISTISNLVTWIGEVIDWWKKAINAFTETEEFEVIIGLVQNAADAFSQLFDWIGWVIGKLGEFADFAGGIAEGLGDFIGWLNPFDSKTALSVLHSGMSPFGKGGENTVNNYNTFNVTQSGELDSSSINRLRTRSNNL